MTHTNHSLSVSKRQWNTLSDLFDYYNEVLFENKLGRCLVNMSRKSSAHGFFAPERWKDETTGEPIHEISLNPETMNRADIKWHSTFVHEMVHLAEELAGTAPRRCYHNKSWADAMEKIGLMPTSTGQPGGKKTGQSVTHYIIAGGAFEVAFNAIGDKNKEALKLPYTPNKPKLHADGTTTTAPGENDGENGNEPEAEKKPASGVKIKYSCGCGFNVWGKPNLSIKCNQCEENFEAAD